MLLEAKKNIKSKPLPTLEIQQQVDALFFEAMALVRKSKYLDSLKTIDKVKMLLPEHPAGYLFSSAVTQWVIKNFRDYSFQAAFYDNIKKTIDYAEDMSPLNAWRYIYIGGAYGFRGIQESENGNFFSAFHDGLRGVNRIKRALKLDDTIYDSYYGLGTYIFWKAYYLDQFFFLSGNPKDKDLGITYIEKCITECKYTSQVAENSLIRIYHVDRRNQESIQLADKILMHSPGNIVILRQLGHSYFDLNDFDQAYTIYQRAKQKLLKHTLTHPLAVMEINYHIARTLVAQKKIEIAQELFEESKEFFQDIDEDIEPMIKIKENFENLIKEMYSPKEI